MKALNKWSTYSVLILLFLGFGISDAFVDTLTSSLNVTDKIKSNYLIISVRLYGVGTVLGSIVNCFLSNYISVRTSLLISSATCAIGALILSFGPPMPAFVFGMAVLGVGISMCRVIAVCILVQYRENAVIGIMYGFSSIGQTTAPFLLRLIQKVTTWKHFFWIIMAYFAIIGIMQFFVLKDVVLYGSKGDLLPIRQKWHGILTDKKLWKRIMSLTLSQLITESWAHWMSTYVKDIKKLTFHVLSIGSFELAIYRSGATVSSICFSHLYKKVGYKRSNLALLWSTCGFLIGINEAQGIRSVSILNAFIGFALAPTLANMLGSISSDINLPYVETTVSFALAVSTTGVVVGPLVLSFLIRDFGIDVIVGTSIVMAFVASLSNIHEPVSLVNSIKALPRRAFLQSDLVRKRLMNHKEQL